MGMMAIHQQKILHIFVEAKEKLILNMKKEEFLLNKHNKQSFLEMLGKKMNDPRYVAFIIMEMLIH